MTDSTDRERLDSLAERVRTWGRWGDDDEAGTLNYVTSTQVQDASRLVRHGRTFSLAMPIAHGYGPQNQGPSGRINPIHMMSATATGQPADVAKNLGEGVGYSDDYLFLSLQGGTQWDALSHLYYDGKLYNGHPASLVTSNGAGACDIGGVHDRFVGRGVLLDVARFKNREVLESGYAITTNDLIECAKAQNTTIEQGDFVIVRTGLLGQAIALGDWSLVRGTAPGLHYEVAEFFAERKIAAVASDTMMVEATGTMASYRVPLHMLLLRDMGLHMGEYWVLDELAEFCAKVGQSEMLLVAAPLPVAGGAGSPVNPMALL